MRYTTLYDVLKEAHIGLEAKIDAMTRADGREKRIDYLNELYAYQILLRSVNKIVSDVIDRAIQKTLSQIDGLPV